MGLYREIVLGLAGMLALAWMAGCAGRGAPDETTFAYKDLPVARDSAAAGEGHTVTFAGNPLELEGPGIQVGEQLRDVLVAKGDLSLTNIADTRGQVRIISVVPSLDTKVCEQQTH